MSADSSRRRLPSPGRLGLLDVRAQEWLDYLGWTDDDAVPVLRALSRAPDPDLALGALVRLRESLAVESHGRSTSASTGIVDSGVAALDSTLRNDPQVRARLLALLGSSSALGDHLVAEPSRWALLRSPLPTREDVLADMLGAVEAVPEAPVADAPEPTQTEDLRSAGTYRAGITGGAAVNLLRSTYRDHIALLAAHDLAATVEADEPTLPFDDVGHRL